MEARKRGGAFQTGMVNLEGTEMWLELHDSSGALHVNMDNVVNFRRYDGGEFTQIATLAASRDGVTTYNVIETPQEIENMIVGEQQRLRDLAKITR
ncbi:hypothetical protein IB238_22895 [Rhizobium sp. ARZ01]|uniref:hypothetical protein n=1 Tax=Rhizobium sp. ARZ01 TaxID=2769313 RepID=UPI0017858B43|nr:hypothetical protein [Rhizobium sp. ARZ01]MBD9375468.1 hypothetical protein [Rhizobium sp. ARZ01]